MKSAAAFLFACLSVSVAPARIASLRLVDPTKPWCKVTNITNTTPVRVTVANTCQLSNGSIVLVSGVLVGAPGPTLRSASINTRPDNWPQHSARKVSNLSANKLAFDLLDMNNSPIPGNGTYCSTCRSNPGRLQVTIQNNLPSNPGILGNDQDEILGTSRNGWAQPSNPVHRALLNAWTFDQSWHNGPGASAGIAGGVGGRPLHVASLLCAENPATYAAQCAWARNELLNNTDVNAGGIVCVPANSPFSDVGCGNILSSFADYRAQWFVGPMGLSISLLRSAGQLSASELQTLADMAYNDQGAEYYGSDYTGSTKTLAPWTVDNLFSPWSAGYLQVTNGSANVVGFGTNFNSGMVGQIIVINQYNNSGTGPSDAVYGESFTIASVGGPTSMTLTRAARFTNSYASYSIAPRWRTGDRGLWAIDSYFRFHPGIAVGVAPLRSFPAFRGPLTGEFSQPDGNLNRVRTYGHFFLALALADADARAANMAQLIYSWFVQDELPFDLTLHTGTGVSHNTYDQPRTYVVTTGMELTMRRSFPNHPKAVPDAWLERATEKLWQWMPDIGYAIALQGNGLDDLGYCNKFQAALNAAAALGPSNTFTKQLHWMLNSYFKAADGGWTSCLTGAGYQAIGFSFQSYNPNVVPSRPPVTTRFFTTSSQGVCQSRLGVNTTPSLFDAYFAWACDSPDLKRLIISKKNLDQTNTVGVFINAIGSGCRNHCAEAAGGQTIVTGYGRPLLGGGYSDFLGGPGHRTLIQLGGSFLNRYQGNEEFFTGQPVPWTKADTSTYMFARVDDTAMYRPAASALNVGSQYWHLKGQSGVDYYIHHRWGRTSGPSVEFISGYLLNNCGTAASTTCVALNSASKTAALTYTSGNPAAVKTSILGYGVAPIRVRTPSGEDSNGTYAGQLGNGIYDFRYNICSDGGGGACGLASDLEAVEVHRITAAAAEMPLLTPSASGSHRMLQIADLVDPHVLVFTREGITAWSVSYTTTVAAKQIVSGLNPGTYSFRIGGVDVPNCTGIAVTSADGTAVCPGAGAGTITVVERKH